MIFTSTPNARAALVRIAEQLFNELRIFGRMAAEVPVTADVLRTYAFDRLAVTDALLMFLEEAADLKFSRGFRFPYLYHTVGWRPGLAPAGYVEPHCEPFPNQVAKSLSASWGLEARTYLLPDRLLTAMLWQAKHHTINEGLTYLFDLYDAGYVSNSRHLTDIASYYLLAAVDACSGDELGKRLAARAAVPGTGWMSWDIDLGKETPEQLDLPGRACISELLERTLTEIERIRYASNLDEWIEGWIHLGGLEETVHRLTRSLVDNPSIATRATLAKLEEIHADAGVFLSRLKSHLPTGRYLLAYAKMIVQAADQSSSFRELVPNLTRYLESLDPDDPRFQEERERWRGRLFPDEAMLDRLVAERLLMPAELGARPGDINENDLPQQWVTISWRVIRPWMAVFRKCQDPSAVRAIPFHPDLLLENAGVNDIFDRLGVLEEQRPEILVGLTEMGSFAADKYPGLEKELERYLEIEVPRLSAEEVQGGLDSAWELFESSHYDTAVTRLEELSKNYWYSWRTYYGLAVGNMSQGKAAAALEHLITAIVLEPREEESWKALGWILSELGHEEEAGLADGIRRAFYEGGLLSLERQA